MQETSNPGLSLAVSVDRASFEPPPPVVDAGAGRLFISLPRQRETRCSGYVKRTEMVREQESAKLENNEERRSGRETVTQQKPRE